MLPQSTCPYSKSIRREDCLSCKQTDMQTAKMQTTKMQGQTTSGISGILKETRDRMDGFYRRSTITTVLLVTLCILVICAFVGVLAWSLTQDPQRHDPDYDDDEDPIDFDDFRTPYYTDVTKTTDIPITPPRLDTSTMAKNVTVSTKTAPSTTTGKLTSTAISTTTTTPSTASTTTTPRVRVLNPCTTDECRIESGYIMEPMNISADPCDSVYKFMCGFYFSRPEENAYDKAQAAIRNASFHAIYTSNIPARGQSAWQISAGLVKACFRHITNKYDEVDALKSWLVEINLDLTNLGAAWRIDPVDMAVRLALDVGVPVLFDFVLSNTAFIEGKRAMKFRISDIREAWLRKHDEIFKLPGGTIRYFRDKLSVYPGYDAERDKKLPGEFLHYDLILNARVQKHVNGSTPFITGAVKDLDISMEPHVKSDKWTAAVSRYTYGTYTANVKVTFQKDLLQDFAEVLASPGWDGFGMRAVMAWGLFEALLPYARLNELANGKDAKAFCFDQALEIMEFPIYARYLRKTVTQTALNKVQEIFPRVCASFRALLEASTWLRSPARDVALRKVAKMKAYIGGPGQRLDENHLNEYYGRFQDIPPDGSFFSGWLKVRSGLVHQKWTDQTNVIFPISGLNPYYVYEGNVVVIPAGALQPVFFPLNGNPAISYARFGNELARAIMKAYDITGVLYDDNGQINPWNTSDVVQVYGLNMWCVQDSHEKAGYSKNVWPLNETLASENVADLVAATAAYSAFQLLPIPERTYTLPGLNLTAEELYFVGRCVEVCKNYSSNPAHQFASPRARCEVPAMNMEAFSQTFGCKAQARMNPVPKCQIW